MKPKQCLRRFLLLLSAAGILLAGCHSSIPAVPTGTTASVTETGSPTAITQETPVPPTETMPPPSETTTGPVCPLPLEDWRLQLVNQDHPISADVTTEMTHVRSGIYVDSRCYADLMAMIEACRAEDLSPLVCSGYRDLEYQTELFHNKVHRLRMEGMTEEEAQRLAQTIVALPGTSEHHIGLAVDIVDETYQQLTEQQELTAVQLWLISHCWEYGFILRYPNGKSDITKIIYEPWHYRYVGQKVAAEIQHSGLCLEEYLAQFQPEGGSAG